MRRGSSSTGLFPKRVWRFMLGPKGEQRCAPIAMNLSFLQNRFPNQESIISTRSIGNLPSESVKKSRSWFESLTTNGNAIQKFGYLAVRPEALEGRSLIFSQALSAKEKICLRMKEILGR